MIKVLIISHGVDGGIDRVSTQLFNFLSLEFSCKIIRVDPVYKVDRTGFRNDEENVVSDKVLHNYISKIGFWIQARKKVSVKIKEYEPAIIIYSGFIPLLFFRNLAQERTSTIFWEHGPQKTLTQLKRIVVSYVRTVDLIVSPTVTSLNWLIQRLKPRHKQSLVIANWIDHRAIKKSESKVNPLSTFKAVVCCRLDSRQKDFQTLFDAVILARGRGIPLEVDIFGQGPDKKLLIEEVKAKGLDSVVCLKGFSHSLNKFYCSYDLSILPTRWEGFGLAIAESMAAGVTPISAAVEGVLDVIADTRTGLLYLPSDAQSLAQKIELFYQLEREEKLRMSKAAVLWCQENYDPDTQLRKFAAAVLSVAEHQWGKK